MHRFSKWRDALQVAPTVVAVNAVMRDYVHHLGPLILTLPSAGKEVLAAAELDVQSAAVTLLHEELTFTGSEEARALLHEIAHTFASASVRITLLHKVSVGN